MKKIKLTALLLASMMVLPTVACGPSATGSNGTEAVDENKTQIYVDHYNGGVGNEWFAPLKARFEAEYANYQIGEKVGVQLIKSDHKNVGTQQIDTVTSSTMDVYFADRFSYYEGISKGVFLEISDVVTETNSDGKTIESKLNTEQQNYYSYNGKYYAIPHYAYYGGINYNIDVFEDNLLYFSDNSAVNGGFITSLTSTRSLGPNGKTGVIDGVDYSTDDGLPATYEEFFKLCDRMVDCDVIPLTWSGEYGKAYFNGVFSRLMATFEGKEQTMLNLTFNGTAKHLVDSISTTGEVTYKAATPITEETGYKIYETAGRYYALKFVEGIFSNRDYYDFEKVNNGSDSHTDAQTRFVLSNYNPSQKPIGMFIDGTYWENEAAGVGVFTTLENVYKTKREDTRFAYMPMPKVDSTHIGENDVVIENSYSLAFINANVQTRCPEKIDLLKKFIKFAYTDESLREFTINTNSMKAVSYELTSADKEKLSYYTRTLVDTLANSDAIYPLSNCSKFSKNQTKLSLNATFSVNNYEFAMNALKDGVSAKDYFNQIISYYGPSYWSQL